MKTSSPNSNLNLDRRLALYAAAATAALAAPTLPDAEAAVIYSGPISINIPSTLNGVYLNVATGASGTSPVSGYDLNPYSASALNFYIPSGGGLVGTANNYFNLTTGTLVSAASSFAATGVDSVSSTTPLNLNSSNNYVGFRFVNEVNGGMVEYGWLQIMLSSSANAQPRAIIGYAYDNTGAGILVGQTTAAVPEAVNTGVLLALVAAGAFGIRAWRQRRAAA